MKTARRQGATITVVRFLLLSLAFLFGACPFVIAFATDYLFDNRPLWLPARMLFPVQVVAILLLTACALALGRFATEYDHRDG